MPAYCNTVQDSVIQKNKGTKMTTDSKVKVSPNDRNMRHSNWKSGTFPFEHRNPLVIFQKMFIDILKTLVGKKKLQNQSKDI